MNQSNFKLKWNFHFWKYNYFIWKPQFWYNNLIWKEKNKFPTVEYIPEFGIKFLKWEIRLEKGTTNEWEFLIWLSEYCNNDLSKSLETWPWKNINNINKQNMEIELNKKNQENQEIDITVWSPLNFPVYAFSTMGFYEIKTEKDLNEHIKWMNFCYLDSYVVDENNKSFLEEKDKELNELLEEYQANERQLKKEEEELIEKRKLAYKDFDDKRNEIIKRIKKEAYLKKFQKINEQK